MAKVCRIVAVARQGSFVHKSCVYRTTILVVSPPDFSGKKAEQFARVLWTRYALCSAVRNRAGPTRQSVLPPTNVDSRGLLEEVDYGSK